MSRALLKNQAGTSILETMIASAIVAGSVAVLSSTLAQQSRSAHDLDQRFTAAEMTNSITSNIDCAETLLHVCNRRDLRLYAPSGPLHFDVPYRVDNPEGPAMEVSCDKGVVNARITIRSKEKESVSPPLFPNGICRRRFSAPRKCPKGRTLIGIDDETAKIECSKGP